MSNTYLGDEGEAAGSTATGDAKDAGLSRRKIRGRIDYRVQYGVLGNYIVRSS